MILKRGIAFVAAIAVICAGFMIFAKSGNKSGAVLADDISYQTDSADAPVVYFTKEISAEAMMKIYSQLGFVPEGKVAIKLSTGEPPASNYLDPNLIKGVVQSAGGTIVECNTAYGGSRASTAAHKQVAKDHGFTDIAEVDIMDEDGSMSLPVNGGENITENFVGAHLENYGSMITLSHFKGHAMGGFGGAIKNMSIGVASKEGKSWIHSAGTSKTNPWGGVQDRFLESMAEATSSVVDYFDGKIVYINVMNRLSVDCDCSGHPAEPDMHDVGILASTDPVALDQACVDIVYSTPREESGSLISRIESRNGIHTLEHAEKIGLGSRYYRLIDIDAQESGDGKPSVKYADGVLTVSGVSEDAVLIHTSYTNGLLTSAKVLEAVNGEQKISAAAGDKFFLWSKKSVFAPVANVCTVK